MSPRLTKLGWGYGVLYPMFGAVKNMKAVAS